jgi:CMP-N-acetylneuraminic acid synthetase
MKVTALLPMKGNSERVPGKNIRDFNGKPLFYHVLETLVSCDIVEEVIINTDSDQFAEMAQSISSKVKIHKRPAEICGDFVSMNDVIRYDIEHSDAQHFIQTHSTNPLLRSKTIEKAVKAYFDKDEAFDSLFSVTRLQTRLFWKNGEAINHDPSELIRTQDLPPVFEENSNFFIFSKESFKNAGNKRIGVSPKMFEVNKIEAVDIDDENDFLIAESLQKLNILQSIDK